MCQRSRTRQIRVGDESHRLVSIGGGAPVSVQSMVSCPTREIDKCVAQIQKLSAAGADLVRLAVPLRKDAEALGQILSQVDVPLIADVHFHFERALEAIQAGVHKIRLNPGNIQDRSQVLKVIDACRERSVPIRIGVNEGSIIERKDKQKRMAELAAVFCGDRHGRMLSIMIAKLEEYLDIFRERDFHDIVISAKSSDPTLAIDAYTQISKRFDYPLHLGVTHAGPRQLGTIRSVAPLAHLLASGIGDTIRLSYSDDPVYEVQDGIELLCCLGLRERTSPELIACPTCGRMQVDLVSLVDDIRGKLESQIHLPMKVAVMGCVVNGPGEAEGADVAVFAGDHRGLLYVQGEQVADITEEQIPDALLAECRRFQARVEAGEAKLGDKAVSILPPTTEP